MLHQRREREKHNVNKIFQIEKIRQDQNKEKNRANQAINSFFKFDFY